MADARVQRGYGNACPPPLKGHCIPIPFLIMLAKAGIMQFPQFPLYTRYDVLIAAHNSHSSSAKTTYKN
jgi:hypothetical protein